MTDVLLLLILFVLVAPHVSVAVVRVRRWRRNRQYKKEFNS